MMTNEVKKWQVAKIVGKIFVATESTELIERNIINFCDLTHSMRDSLF
jgi:hypothetical protein